MHLTNYSLNKQMIRLSTTIPQKKRMLGANAGGAQQHSLRSFGVYTHTLCAAAAVFEYRIYTHTHTLCAAAAVASQRRVVSAALAPAGSRRGRGVGGGEGRAASPCVTPPCVTSPCVPFDVCNLP